MQDTSSVRSTKSPKCISISGHNEHTSTFDIGLLPSGLSPSAPASHRVCTPPSLENDDALAGSFRPFHERNIPPVGNFTLSRSRIF